MKKLFLIICFCLLVYVGFRIHWIWGIFTTLAVITYAVYRLLPALMQVRSRKYFMDGDYESAKKVLAKAVSIKSASDDVKMEYSYILMRTGDFKDAEEVVDKILRNPVDANLRGRAVIQRCLCYYKQDNLKEALEDATELFESGYRSMTLYGLLGYFKLLLNPNAPETFDFCKEAYEYASDDRDICDNLLICYYNKGEYERAKEISDAVLENNPKFVEAWYHAAQIDCKLGDYKSAKEKLDKIPDCNRSYMTTVSEEDVEKLINDVNSKLEGAI